MRLLESQLPLTLEGRDELALEISCLEQIRQEILAESHRASEIKANALRTELAAVEDQISRLRQALDRGTLVSDTGLIVAIGSEVTLAGRKGEQTVTIGGPIAANPRVGCISYESHLARAIIGHQLGDMVELASPRERQEMKIVGIRPGRPGTGRG